jgi:hypothetical protein
VGSSDVLMGEDIRWGEVLVSILSFSLISILFRSEITRILIPFIGVSRSQDIGHIYFLEDLIYITLILLYFVIKISIRPT